MAVSRTLSHLETLQKEITEMGADCSVIACDLSDAAATQKALDESAGDIDLLINNAGYSHQGFFNKTQVPTNCIHFWKLLLRTGIWLSTRI